MNREEAFKILEARILVLLSRISHLEEENARLQKDLSSKAAQLQAAQAKVNIAAEQLHVELERLKAIKGCVVPKQSLKNMAAGSSTTVKTVLLLRNFWCQPSSNLQFMHRQKHLVHKFIIVQLRMLA